MTYNEQRAQAAILILSGAAAYLATRGSPAALAWGCALGLAGQPFWLWSSWRHRQWGIFALSVWYVWAWGSGLWGALGSSWP